MRRQDRILNFLRDGGRLTRIEAWSELGILEAPARISELRSAGHKILTEMVTVFNRYNEPVRVARWTYPQTPQDEVRYLTDKRIRLIGERQQACDENNWLRVDKLDIDIKVIDESVRTLRAIRGVAA